jgi:colanic acid biosynthesis glycosyl transferase WcaI
MDVFRLYTYVSKDKANVWRRIVSYGSFNLLSVLKGAHLPKHDVLLVPSPPLSNGVIADVICRFKGTPFIYNVQDIWPDVAVRAGVLKNPKAIARLRKMENFVYRRAAKITVISDGFKQNLIQKGVPEEKIEVIPNFIDLDFIVPTPKPNSFTVEHGLEGKFVVLFAGNMGFSQGLETVIDAAKLVEDNPNIVFLMVGNGAAKNSAVEYASRVSATNVRFLPFQPHEKLPEMYGASDLCVVPLRRGFSVESVPCKLFTIMAAGKPAIAAVDEGSETTSVISQSGAGSCVAPGDADELARFLKTYYSDRHHAHEAGLRGRKYVELHFHPKMIAASYASVMQSVASTHRR